MYPMINLLSKNEESIVALCTPQGSGALALIRITGTNAIEIVEKFALLPKNKLLSQAPTHTIHFGHIINNNKNNSSNNPSSEIIDEVLFFLMKAPKTFTGQNTVEISCHNNPFLINKIISIAISFGARAAEPGEFSKRAFLNNKIDLAQAESINELIGAQNEIVIKKSLEQLKGSLSAKIKNIEEEIIKLLSLVEASFEFIEEEQKDLNFNNIINEQFKIILENINSIKSNFNQQQQIKEGLRIGILGAVNAGKSTLFNTLIKKDRSIVTNIPGTTRDSIEAHLYKDGSFWTFIDTAGLRETEDIVEKQGIERAWQEACKADILLLVISANDTELNNDQIILYNDALEKYKDKIILVLNKIDQQDTSSILKKLKHDLEIIKVSAQEKIGIENLENKISEKIELSLKNFKSPFLINKRHFDILQNVENSILKLQEAFESQILGNEILGQELKDVLEKLMQLTGRNINEKMLDEVFKNFCIGK